MLQPDTTPETGEVSPFGVQIVRKSVSQQAHAAIRNSSMRSWLKPGQGLVARQVADELGISVTPVRESLLRLVSEHVLALDERLVGQAKVVRGRRR
jgi:DNA-binding GntR family transcriptional regulator